MATDSGSVPSSFAQLVALLRRVFAPAEVVPFQYRNRPLNGTRDGLGENHIPGATAQNAPVAVNHKLARVPVGVALVDNAALAPTRLQVTARSSTSVTIVPLDAALDATAIIRVF